MHTNSRNIAVLTGDLVHSGQLGSKGIEIAFRSFRGVANHLETWSGGKVHMSRHRGDGWQAVLLRPELALRSALAIRASLRTIGNEYDSYIGIATGSARMPLSPDLNYETAPVFVTSGDLLDQAKSRNGSRMRHSEGGAIAAATILADYISQGWTPTQAKAIFPFLDPHETPSYSEVALLQGKSRQAVTKAAEAAGMAPILSALDAIESHP